MTTGLLLAVAASALFAGCVLARSAATLWLASSVVASLTGLAASFQVLLTSRTWDWQTNFLVGGEKLHLRLDGLSAFFLVLVFTVSGLGALYGREYWADHEHPRSAPQGRTWWSIFVLGMVAVLLCSNGLHFLIAWETFAVAGFFLIVLDGSRSEVRRAGWLYLAASHAGSLVLFAFFALWAGHLGSWELGPVHQHQELAPLFWLALLGFGVKAGLLPLHIWLPSAHANSPSHVSAILSGVAIKMGIYGIIRFSGWLPLPAGAPWAVIALGLLSAVLGVAFALGQHDLKRLLAYHSVENIGIILLGLGFSMLTAGSAPTPWTRLAIAGGLLHVWNHGLFKSLLFLGAGSVVHASGTRTMSQLGGLWRAMPWTTSLFALGAVAICGLPPLNGLVSEWFIYLSMFDATTHSELVALTSVAGIILLAVTGALALACFVKVCGVVFLGAPRSPAALQAHECGTTMRIPMFLLAATCLAIGLFPNLVWPLLQPAVGVWLGVSPTTVTPPDSLHLLARLHLTVAVLGGLASWSLWRMSHHFQHTRTPTWDCGYAAPTSRMQYTAGSFAGMLTSWFSWSLQPRQHHHDPVGPFPLRADHREHTPETVLELIVEPCARRVLDLAGMVRRLQHGRLQSYLLYVIIGLVGVALLVFLGDGSK